MRQPVRTGDGNTLRSYAHVLALLRQKPSHMGVGHFFFLVVIELQSAHCTNPTVRGTAAPMNSKTHATLTLGAPAGRRLPSALQKGPYP